MSFEIRKSNERGFADLGWLESYHSFSFGGYQDLAHNGFSHLRVINDDVVEAGNGFKTHPHDNMEIVSYVVSGELAHKDSMGNGSVIKAGEVQIMSAGTGVTHSEFNNSAENSVRFLQIWFFPDERNIAPAYNQKLFSKNDKLNKFKLVVSKDAKEDSININQNIDFYASIIEKNNKISHEIANDNAWLQVISGKILVNGDKLEKGDGLKIKAEKNITVKAEEDSELIFFDIGN